MTLEALERAMCRVVEYRMLKPHRRDAHRFDLRNIKILRAEQLDRVGRQLVTFGAALLAATEENPQGREDLIFDGLPNPLGRSIGFLSRKCPTRHCAAE
jgi:hypothetical protein